MKYSISKIRSLIAETGLTETNFLHSVGLGAKTLIRWECGDEIPREDYISFIAQALGVEVSSLVYNEAEKILSKEQIQIEIPLADTIIKNENEEILTPTKKNTKAVDLSYLPPSELRKLPIEDRRKLYNDYPNKLFQPTGTAYYEKFPKRCPYDNEPLRHLKVSNRKRKGGNRQWCCLACFRNFFPKSEQPNMVLEKKGSSPNCARVPNNLDESKLVNSSAHNDILHNQSVQRISSSDGVILTATLHQEGASNAPFSLTIVANEHKQDSSKNIYWVGRALPAAVLAAIKTNDRSLLYKGTHYQVIDFAASGEAEKYLKIISRFSNPTAPQTVYVFSQKNVATFKPDRYEMVTAMIPCADHIYPIPVNVYYDKTKQQYFINEATYTNLRKTYGLPYMRLQVATGNGASQWFETLKPHSELNLLGYNVSVSEGLSTENRRKILRDAVDSGVIQKGEIINHLEWLIHTMGKNPNMENAVGEWNSDLMYISKYHATEQRKIWIDKFKSRFSEKYL